MSKITKIDNSGIYTDLMKKYRREGHDVYIIYPNERRSRREPVMSESDGVHFLGVRTLNLQKANVIEKGIGQLLVEYQYIKALKNNWENICFDLILFSTPPITFSNVIQYLRRKNPQAMTYLLLKDIFPQNAVDLGMMSKTGLKGILYVFFRKKEKKLYALSDYIGCMSPANMKYLLEQNPEISPNKVELAPNSYERTESVALTKDERRVVRERYSIPNHCPVFIYGGNLGKPQGIPFLIQCLDANKYRDDCHFVVVGDGTEYGKLEKWFKSVRPKCISIFNRLPKDEYDQLVRSCDVGLIFLDNRFTIPNFPSRLLPYLMEKKPIIAATDLVCDMGPIAEQNGFGFWCRSNSVNDFTICINRMLSSDMDKMGEKGYQFFLTNYTIDNTYSAIMHHF